MILKASIDHKIDLKRSVLVGDRCSDIQAGSSAGIPNLILVRGTEASGCADTPVHSVVSELHEIIPLLMRPNAPA
jgi:D-glycero-D-manno-heptose 1,7-bisphosphate phosphatase